MTKITRYVLTALLTAALIPYLVVCFYAFPFADDFCFGWTASESIPFVQKFLNQYLLWNGRYTADMLVNVHPLTSGKIIYYQLCSFVAIVAMPVVVYGFVISLLSTTQIQDFSPRKNEVQNDKKGRFYAAIFSLFITLFYLNYQPNITEGIYWYIGIANYHLGNLLLLVQITLLLNALSATGKMKITLHAISLLLLVVSVGFNEVGALLIPSLYFLLFVLHFQLRSLNFRLSAVYCAVAIIASAFVFFSPGNFVRANEFENRYNLLHSLLYATLQTGRFIAQWILNVAFVLLSVIVIAYADKIKTRFSIDYRLLLVACVVVVFTGSFLPYFATGILGQHRTINYVFFFFLQLWVLLLLEVSTIFQLYQKLKFLTRNTATTAFFTLAIILMLTDKGNSASIINDFRWKGFQKYMAECMARQETLKKDPYGPIPKLQQIPNTFKIFNADGNRSWVNKCMRNYYIEAKMEIK